MHHRHGRFWIITARVPNSAGVRMNGYAATFEDVKAQSQEHWWRGPGNGRRHERRPPVCTQITGFNLKAPRRVRGTGHAPNQGGAGCSFF
jgi:hypothetical protein